MADRQLTMLLTFEADANKAKKEIADLASSLKSIAAMPAVGSNVNTEKLKEGSQAAKELLHHLQAAVNTDTGKLNLASFASSLKQSGKTLEDYKRKLESCGPAGQEAFLKVARSVATAENPVRRLNKTFGNLLTTLKNTAKWQLSSMMIHGFMGALQSAYGYAQDLNKSLTNIRIVTGQSAEQMEAFALKANKAAKELSASTLAYTDAALIYYQQGLDDQAVKARTDVTVKMMNVTGKSAEEISSQMTAIWNNFDDGTKSLEYYADAITALGASTASSSKEIAEGLQKFAAVADTVGLSYEYATAALATVVAETRQSADIVGTAFKTLFSRLEGLKLGKTLEDGVDLNKYSAALQTVGVNILDANGNLREMDIILDELGERWKALNSAQQVALAQTVGGVRQYQQFIALMDNWDKVQKNVEIATNSEGTLQKQADIYADSWEGAKQRVQASLQSIYTSIIDDKAFINMTNGISKILEGVNGLIKGFGGIEGVLLTIANIFAQRYAKEVPAFLERVKENLLIISGKAAKMGNELQNSMLKNIQGERDSALRNADNLDSSDSMTQAAEMEVLNQIGQKRAELNARSAEYSEAERQQIETEIALLEKKGDSIIAMGQNYDTAKNQASKLYSDLVGLEKVKVRLESGQTRNATVLGYQPKDFAYAYTQMKRLKGALTGWMSELKRSNKISDQSKKKLQALVNTISESAKGNQGFQNSLKDITKKMNDLDPAAENAAEQMHGFLDEIKKLMNSQEIDLSTLDLPPELIEKLRQAGIAFEDVGKKGVFAHEALDEFGNGIPPMISHTTTLSEGIVSLAGGLMQYTALLSSATRIGDVFTNEDATVIEKITQVISFLTTGVFAYISLTKGLKTLNNSLLTQAQKSFALKQEQLVTDLQQQGIDYKNLSIKQLHQLANNKLSLTEQGLISAKTQETVAVEANTTAWYSNPITAVIAIALAAVVAVISIVTSAMKANTESVKENAQAEIDRNKKIQDEIKNNKELLNNYRALYKANKDKLKVSKELADAARETAKAYGVENAEILIAQGRYDELNKRIDEARQKEIELGEAAAASAEASAFSLFSDKMHTKTSGFLNGGTYNGYNVGSEFRAEFERGWSESDENDVGLIELAKKHGFGQTTTGDLYLQMENTEEGLINIFETVQTLTEELRERNKNNISKLQEATAYQNMIAFLNNSQETYENLITLRNEALYSILDNTLETDLNSFDNKIVNNLKEYQQVEENLIKILMQHGKTEAQAKKLVESYVNQDSNLVSWNMIDNLAANKEGFADWYDSLSDEEKTLIPSINFDYLDTTEQWNAALKYAEDHSRLMKVSLQITEADTALEEFKTANEATGLDKNGDSKREKELNDWYNKYAAQYDIEIPLEKFISYNEDYLERYVLSTLGQGWANLLSPDNLTPSVNDKVFQNYTADKEKLTNAEKDLTNADTKFQNNKPGYINKLSYYGTNMFDDLSDLGFKSDTLAQLLSHLNLNDFKPDESLSSDYIEYYMDLLRENMQGFLVNVDQAVSDWNQNSEIKYTTYQDDDNITRVERADGKNLTDDDLMAIRQIYRNAVSDTGTTVWEIGKQINNAYPGFMSEFFGQIADNVEDATNMQSDMYDLYDFFKILLPMTKDAEAYYQAKGTYDTQEQEFSKKYTAYGNNFETEVKEITAVAATFIKNLKGISNVIDTWTTDTIITEKEYQGISQILAQNEMNAADYFLKLADGTYQVIGNLDQLKTAVGSTALDIYSTELKDLNQIDFNNFEYDETHVKQLLEHFGFNDNLLEVMFSEDGAFRTEFKAGIEHLLNTIDTDKIAYEDAIISSINSIEDILSMSDITSEFSNDNKEVLNNKFEEIIRNTLTSSTSLDAFNLALTQSLTILDEVPYDTISTALINLGANYTNATNEVQNYQKALLSNDGTLKIAEDNLKASIMIGEAAKEYKLEADILEEQATQIANAYKITKQEAAQLAIKNERMNKGISTLNKNFKDWSKTLKENNKLSSDYAEVITKIREALQDVLGVSKDFNISAEFISKHLKDIEKASQGDTKAIARLGNELAKVNIQELDISDIIFADTSSSTVRDEFESWQEIITNGIDIIGNKLENLKDGASLDEIFADSDLTADEWITNLNAMSEACGWTVGQMQNMLNSLNLQADVELQSKELIHEVPRYKTIREITGWDGNFPTEWTEQVISLKPEPVKEWVQFASIGTDTNPAKPANIHYRSPSSSGGISTSSTSSNSSNSKKEKKDKKSAEKETERYHEITALIEDYTKELEKAGKAKDRAFGPAKVKAMQAEIAAQAQLNAGTEEYIREIEEWLAIDKQRIQSQGAIFDEYGNISNYTELMQQHIDAYNAAVATYNASAQEDADKERFEEAEKAYNDFIDQLNQYEETNNLLQEQQETLLDGLQQIYDLTTQKNQYIIEFKIQADDDAIAFIDYLKNKLENFTDGVNDAAEKLAYLNDEAARLMSKNSTYNEAIDMTLQHYLGDQKGWDQSAIDNYIERFKNNALTEADMSALEDMSEEEFNYLREMRDNLLEINNSLIENMNQVVETVQESFTKTAEDLDKAARPIERAASALENYAAIIDIVGRDALGITDAIAAELDNAAVAVAHSATVAAKAKVDTLQSERDRVQQLYDEAMAQGLTEMAYKWKTVLEEMDDEIASATDDFNSKWQEELTKAREAFENTVERIKQSMLDAFAGSIGSWSALKDSMEYAKTAADRFVPQYKEIYELSKLNRDIMKSIDNTSNLKNKQALRDLQKEINELEQHSGEISQYDLDNARRRYELELARLQLEEARDAKSTVRLSKDSEGNWSYVYTANQDEVEKAEQNYEDKLYAMQQANNEYINSLSDQILELEEQYAEKLAEIRLDNTMSEEERNAAIERLNAYFTEQMEYLTNEGQKAVDNNSRLFEEEWTTYHNWTDAFGNDTQARIDNQHDFMTQFGDTILGSYTGYGNFNELNAAMVEIAQQASADMEIAYGELADQIADAMEGAGYNVETFGQTVSDTVHNEIVPSAQDAEQAVVDMAEAAANEFATLASSVSEWQTTYATEMKKIMDKNEELALSVGKVTDAYAALVAQMYAAANAPAPEIPTFNNSTADGYTNDGSSNLGGGGSHEGRETNPYNEQVYAYEGEDSTIHFRYVDNEEHQVYRRYTGGPKVGQMQVLGLDIHHHDANDRGKRTGDYVDYFCKDCRHTYTKYEPRNIGGGGGGGQAAMMLFATGGYTGDWNSADGKLAILHEKELVLNKEDTKNILGTVEMVRKLSSKIDLNAQTARYAFNYHPIISEPRPVDKELQVDQTVTISAEFPNVQNRTEIEEAFTTLINQASQFANRKF